MEINSVWMTQQKLKSSDKNTQGIYYMMKKMKQKHQVPINASYPSGTDQKHKLVSNMRPWAPFTNMV